MSKIVFFCIPAYGHTNPTIPVVRELIINGHEVWYYSFLEFQGKIKKLKAHGYAVDNLISMLQNDNNTDTIVYTSKTFQPMSDTFSDRYAFVGPSIRDDKPSEVTPKKRKQIYISLGTVLNQNVDFYKNCIQAFRDKAFDVIMSVGDKTSLASLGKIPPNFIIKNRVNQIEILKQTDVFITHCGMNSVNESLYFGVPMVLFPQHSREI